jgi:hypothetical protein
MVVLRTEFVLRRVRTSKHNGDDVASTAMSRDRTRASTLLALEWFEQEAEALCFLSYHHGRAICR